MAADVGSAQCLVVRHPHPGAPATKRKPDFFKALFFVNIKGVCPGLLSVPRGFRPQGTESQPQGICVILPLLCALTAFFAPLARAAPSNDNFTNPQGMESSLPSSASGNNTGATVENDENVWGGNSVWYSWVAPSSGWVTIDTIATGAVPQLDTIVMVFTGASLAGLQVVGWNDEGQGRNDASQFAFQAVAGTKYLIAVLGFYDGTTVQEGSFELHLSSASPRARVEEITANPSTTDVSVGWQTANITTTIKSDADLFAGNTLSFSLRAPDGYSALPPVPITSAHRISGNLTSGTYRIPIPLPSGMMPGKWIPSLKIQDAISENVWSPGSAGAICQDHWIIPGSTTALEVSNNGTLDAAPPTLAGFSVSPGSAAPYEKITLQLDISDNFSGFHRADIWLADGGQWLAGVTSENRVSGNATSGRYEVPFNIPADLSPGEYRFEIWLSDAVGIWAGYNGTQLGNVLSGNPLVVEQLTLGGWRIKFFGLNVDGGNAANLADPDRDGIVNLLEFATNHDPIIPDRAAHDYGVTGNSLTFRYSRSDAAVAEGVQFVVEWADALGGDWSTVGVTESVTPGSPADQIQASVPLGTSAHRFMRLRAFFTP